MKETEKKFEESVKWTEGTYGIYEKKTENRTIDWEVAEEGTYGRY